jgi:hypothetical protein
MNTASGKQMLKNTTANAVADLSIASMVLSTRSTHMESRLQN